MDCKNCKNCKNNKLELNGRETHFKGLVFLKCPYCNEETIEEGLKWI